MDSGLHPSSGPNVFSSGKKELTDTFQMGYGLALSSLQTGPRYDVELQEHLIPSLGRLSLGDGAPPALADLHQASLPVEPPAPRGGFVEESIVPLSPHAKPRDVLPQLACVLRDRSVDCVVKEEKFKLSCAIYRCGEKLAFKVRIYTLFRTAAPNSKYHLEFQRRQGNCVLFYELFRGVTRQLADSGLVLDIPPQAIPFSPFSCGATDPLAPPSLRPPSPPSLLSPPPLTTDLDVTKSGNSIRMLCEMAQSPFRDVKCQALRSLAAFSAEPCMQQSLCDQGAFEVFVASLPLECEDANRCAITGLANLAKAQEPSCRQLVQQGCVRQLLATVRSKGANGSSKGFTPQIVREIARLLVNVREKLGKDILGRCDKLDAHAEAVTEARDALQSLMCSSDPVVRQHADTLHDVLGGTELVHTGVAGGYGRFVPSC